MKIVSHHIGNCNQKRQICERILNEMLAKMGGCKGDCYLVYYSYINKGDIDMNTVIEAIEARRCVRSYRATQVKTEDLNLIMEAGTFAPTGSGKQSPVIIGVQDKQLRDELSRLNAHIMGKDTDPFYGAPTVILVLADGTRSTYLQDGSLVMGNMMLAASTLGLGSCWVHRAKEVFETSEGRELLKAWGLEGYVGIGNCIVGYPEGDKPKAAPRKDGYTRIIK